MLSAQGQIFRQILLASEVPELHGIFLNRGNKKRGEKKSHVYQKILSFAETVVLFLFCLLCVFTFKRAKKIRNKAVVNAGPTEKLIRELKAEKNKLLSRMAGLGSARRSISDEARTYFSINTATGNK